MNRLVTLATLLFLLAAHGADSRPKIFVRDWLRSHGYEQIALRRSGENRLFLFGKLNGCQRSVLVDTGWSFTTVSTNKAEKLNAKPELELPPGDPFPRMIRSSPAVLMNSLRLGRVYFTNQPALVQGMVFNGQRAPFDVVLGCDFLLRNFAVIDCLNRRLYARRSAPTREHLAEFEKSLRQSGFMPVELKRTKPLALACPARLNDEPVDLLMDTGAVWSCLDSELAKRLGLKLLPTPRQITGAGATGKRGFAVAKVNSVELGGTKMPGQNFAVLELGDWGLAATGAALAEVGGILGGPELAAFSAIIDCHGLKLWLKPPSARR
jgi:predicted aspartyl protease